MLSSVASRLVVLVFLVVLLCVLLPFPCASQSAPYSCVVDDDCSLNGVCDSGRHVCECDAGWTGFDCGVLALAPGSRSSGYNLTGSGTSSWGGKPIVDPVSGAWLLFAAEFTGGCGLDYWSPMSRIIRAVSVSGPAGPYTFDAQVVGTFAHNPTVVWSGSDKLWLLYHIGCAVTQPASCQYGGIQCDDANNENGESSISMWASDDLKTWRPHGVVLGPNGNNTWDMVGSRNTHAHAQMRTDAHTLHRQHAHTCTRRQTDTASSHMTHLHVLARSIVTLRPAHVDCLCVLADIRVADRQDTTNPSPFPLWTPNDNTTAVLLAYRGCPYDCGGWEMLNLALAKHYSGPYHRLHEQPVISQNSEDPFLWRDKRGHFHMLMHSLEAGGGFGDGPKVGRHAYARRLDGHWTFGNRTLAFNTSVQWTDGTSTDFYRRERPQLVFSDDGQMTPLYLSNGVQEVNQSSSYTVIQPLSTAKQWEIQHGYRKDDAEQQQQQQQQNRHARQE